MARKPNMKPPQPLKMAKAGSLKAAVAKGGGGKKTLKTLRAAPKATRQMVATTKGVDVKALARTIRGPEAGAEKGISKRVKRLKAAGMSASEAKVTAARRAMKYRSR